MMKHRRVVLVGQAPARRTSLTLRGRTGKKLVELMMINERLYLKAFERKNVLARYPGRSARGEGDLFPMAIARKRARRIRKRIRRRIVVFVGRRVARAFRFEAPFLQWRAFEGGMAAVVPHPSGVNRWWNSDENRRAASAFLSTVIMMARLK